LRLLEVEGRRREEAFCAFPDWVFCVLLIPRTHPWDRASVRRTSHPFAAPIRALHKYTHGFRSASALLRLPVMSSPPHPPSARPVGRPAVRSVRYNPLKTPPPQYTVDLEADNISPCVHLLLETYIYDFANIDDGAPKQSSRCRALVEDAVDALLLVFDFLDGDYDAKSFIRYLCVRQSQLQAHS
jgi:hypothetical protein